MKLRDALSIKPPKRHARNYNFEIASDGGRFMLLLVFVSSKGPHAPAYALAESENPGEIDNLWRFYKRYYNCTGKLPGLN